MNDRQLRQYGRDLLEIIEARKAAGKPPIRRLTRQERYEQDPDGYRYDYLNDAGTELYG